MLQNLVNMYDVEAVVGEVKRVDITNSEVDVHDSLLVCKTLCFFEWCGYVFYACYVALGYAPGEVHADGTWAAADVENGHVGFDVWEEVWC